MMSETAERPERPPRARDAVPSPASTTGTPTVVAENSAGAATWEEFCRLHDNSYLVTDAALQAEIGGNVQQAIDGYQKGLDLMEKALAIESHGNQNITAMQQKIRRAQKETLAHLVDMQSARAAAAAGGVRQKTEAVTVPDTPPSYESLYPSVPPATGPLYPGVPSQETSVSPHLAVRVAAAAEEDQARALMEIAEDTDGGCLPLPRDIEELFALATEAQLFFVAPDGSVSAPSAPASLRICQFTKGATGAETPAGSPEAFLQVGDWTYPLIPGCSPVLHSNFGPYMFPDLERPGWHVALLLPETVSVAERRRFESLMSQLTALVTQPASVDPAHPTAPAPAAGAAQRTKQEGVAAWLSGGLVKGAELLSKGLVAGAGKLSQYMDAGTTKLQSNMAPAQGPPAKVDPKVQRGLEVAREVSGGVLKASEFVVTQVGKGTMALARYIAPHVKTTGTKILKTTKIADEKGADSKMDDVMEVASGAVRGFGLVYTGLETAATLLYRSLSNNTVQLVQHRYGPDAGRVTNYGLDAAGNLVLTGHNVHSLGAKGLAKRVAKDTGRTLIDEHEQNRTRAGVTSPPGGHPPAGP